MWGGGGGVGLREAYIKMWRGMGKDSDFCQIWDCGVGVLGR